MLATHGVIQLLAKLVFGTANVASCVAFMMMLGQLPTASNMVIFFCFFL
jgi:hypothetical protein